MAYKIWNMRFFYKKINDRYNKIDLGQAMTKVSLDEHQQIHCK